MPLLLVAALLALAVQRGDADRAPSRIALPMLLDFQPVLLPLDISRDAVAQIGVFCRLHGLRAPECATSTARAVDQVVDLGRWCRHPQAEWVLPGFMIARRVLPRGHQGEAEVAWRQDAAGNIAADLCAFGLTRVDPSKPVTMSLDECSGSLTAVLTASFDWILALEQCTDLSIPSFTATANARSLDVLVADTKLKTASTAEKQEATSNLLSAQHSMVEASDGETKSPSSPHEGCVDSSDCDRVIVLAPSDSGNVRAPRQIDQTYLHLDETGHVHIHAIGHTQSARHEQETTARSTESSNENPREERMPTIPKRSADEFDNRVWLHREQLLPFTASHNRDDIEDIVWNLIITLAAMAMVGIVYFSFGREKHGWRLFRGPTLQHDKSYSLKDKPRPFTVGVQQKSQSFPMLVRHFGPRVQDQDASARSSLSTERKDVLAAELRGASHGAKAADLTQMLDFDSFTRRQVRSSPNSPKNGSEIANQRRVKQEMQRRPSFSCAAMTAMLTQRSLPCRSVSETHTSTAAQKPFVMSLINPRDRLKQRDPYQLVAALRTQRIWRSRNGPLSSIHEPQASTNDSATIGESSQGSVSPSPWYPRSSAHSAIHPKL